MKRLLVFFVLALIVPRALAADNLRLEGFAYPFPVQIFKLSSQQQDLEMACMDVPPATDGKTTNGTVVLLHGKNFSGAYWKETAENLSQAGYRVIIPDQIGFGKSSKPATYQYSFHQLATLTHALLRSLGITDAHVLGHSMGGMVATRYALMFPEATRSLILVNPLGLEDWKAKGVPYSTVDQSYQKELAQTPEKIRAYQTEYYYDGQWQPAYDRWVEMLALFIRSPDYARMAWNQALTFEMIYTQPVCYEFGQLKMPVLLIIGQRDRTAPGKEQAPVAARATLGDYPALGRAAAAAMPRATLVELDGLGHLPQIEAFPRFIAPLRAFLGSAPAAVAAPTTGN